MTATMKLTGVKELDKRLELLADRDARASMRAGINAGLTVMGKGIRSQIPARFKSIKKTIGKRFRKSKANDRSKGLLQAKVGINVAKKQQRVPHAHLLAMGTKLRIGDIGRQRIGGKFAYLNPATTRQLRTGKIQPNDFVERGFKNSQGAAASRMKQKAGETMLKKAAKA